MTEYTKLDRSDRFVIKSGINRRESYAEIARTIEKHRSVVMREIKKNGGRYWYDPEKAHEKAQKSSKKGYCKIEAHPGLKGQVIVSKQGQSPNVIAGVMKRDNHPDAQKIVRHYLKHLIFMHKNMIAQYPYWHKVTPL